MADTNNQQQQQQQRDGQQNQQSAQQPQQQQTVEIDYDKIASLVQGKQTVAEDTVLKGYFKQQGLSQAEIEQAISQFKVQKAAQEPDLNQIQQQLTQAQQIAQQAQTERAATLAALELGIDVKTVPYLLKMADLSGAVNGEGQIDAEALKTAINKVLEDIPQLKPEKQENTGFQQIGAGGGNQQANNNDALASIFGNKKG